MSQIVEEITVLKSGLNLIYSFSIKKELLGLKLRVPNGSQLIHKQRMHANISDDVTINDPSGLQVKVQRLCQMLFLCMGLKLLAIRANLLATQHANSRSMAVFFLAATLIS